MKGYKTGFGSRSHRTFDRYRRLQAENLSKSPPQWYRHLMNTIFTGKGLTILTLFLLSSWFGLVFWFYRGFKAANPQLLRQNPETAYSTYITYQSRKERLDEEIGRIERKRRAGGRLSDQEIFGLNFKRLSLTKSLVSGSLHPAHCTFEGPKAPMGWTKMKEEHLKDLLVTLGTDRKSKLEAHLENNKGTLCSLDHDFCTSKHPYPYMDSFLGNEYRNSIRGSREPSFSAYVFEDVCITFNIDSAKRAQRSVVIFDNTNIHKERCSPCPNPQMNHDWGSNECGMMWLHQMNVKSLKDFNECYSENKDIIKSHGQRQEPGETTIDGAIYYRGSTLLLQFVHLNPGHQLWDFLFSLLPILINKSFRPRIFDHSIAHQAPECSSSLWTCQILRKLGLFKSKTYSKENLIIPYKNILTCFEKLIAPIPGWNHNNNKFKPAAVELLKEQLIQAFELKKVTQLNTISRIKFLKELNKIVKGEASILRILLYPHNTIGESGRQRRAWLDVAKTHESFRNQGLATNLVKDFSKLSIEDQARLFYESNIQIMPHGGQMGNSIFSRSNTLIIEISCNGYSHMASGNDYTYGLRVYHIVYTPCNCTGGHTDESNFWLSFEEIISLIRIYADGETEDHGSLPYSCILNEKKALPDEMKPL